jgi:ESCRT-I complex subunit VPS28
VKRILLVLQFECPAAMERIEDGCPITIKDDKGNTSKSIADIVAVRKAATL